MTGPLSGSRAWAVQRVTALYLLAFLVFVLAYSGAARTPWTYEAWRAWLHAPGVTVAVLLFFVALLLHAWVGVRDVLLDYVHPLSVRTALLALLVIGELAVAAWVLLILLR